MRLLFTLLLFLAAIASVLAPGWSRAQAIQGYYYDLVASLLADPPQPIAGAPVNFNVVAANRGPDLAPQPAIVATADSVLEWTGSQGCAGSPAFAPRCDLGPALVLGQSDSASLRGRLAPSARGTVVIGVAAIADGRDVVPGNEITVLAMPIRVIADLDLELVARDSLIGGQQVLTVRVTNDGPSAIERFSADWKTQGDGGNLAWTCAPVRLAQCPVGVGEGRMSVQGVLLYSFVFPPLTVDVPTMRLDFTAIANDATPIAAGDTLSVLWTDSIVSDGFE